MVEQGLVDRLHDVVPTSAAGRWRWKSEINTVDELRAQAAAQGVVIR